MTVCSSKIQGLPRFSSCHVLSTYLAEFQFVNCPDSQADAPVRPLQNVCPKGHDGLHTHKWAKKGAVEVRRQGTEDRLTWQQLGC